MNLDRSTVKSFAEIIDNESSSGGSTVYGTVKSHNGVLCVSIDGSEEVTPVVSSVDIRENDRVIVTIRNHTAIVTNNLTEPPIGVDKAEEITDASADEIHDYVDESIAGVNADISVTNESITMLVENQDEFSEFKQTVEGFSFMSKGGDVKISGGDISLTGAITFDDFDEDLQDDLESTSTTASNALSEATDASSTASSALLAASSAKSTVDAWTYTGTTYIDGKKIMTGTIEVSTLKGGTINLLDSSGSVSGTITTTTATSAEYAIDLSSSGAMRLTAGSGALFLTGGGKSLHLHSSSIQVEGDFVPGQDSGYNLGFSNYAWKNVYSTSGVITTSDRRAKTNITALSDKYGDMFDLLKPVTYKLIEGTSGRQHVGLVAQDVEEAMASSGIDSTEFGGFIKDKDNYSLRYEEFIAICIDQIQKLKTRVKNLEG